jgi:hypothetical protein
MCSWAKGARIKEKPRLMARFPDVFHNPPVAEYENKLSPDAL